MTINYDAGQVITFSDKTDTEAEKAYDFFPPMMFCKAATEQDRHYLCHSSVYFRRGITADHPFMVWLLANVDLFNQYYCRDLEKIIYCLCNSSAREIIAECNSIREHLMALPEHHGIRMNDFPKLSESDFWNEAEET